MSLRKNFDSFTPQHKLRDAEEAYVQAVYRLKSAEEAYEQITRAKTDIFLTISSHLHS